MKKKTIAVLLVLLLTLSFAGCKDGNGPSPSETATGSPTQSPGQTTAPPAEMDFSFSERDTDASYDVKTATVITCADGAFDVQGEGATADGTVLTVSKEGTYVISGEMAQGRIVVQAGKKEKVQIVLNGLSLHCGNHAPLYIVEADKVFITLAEQSENTLSDGDNHDDAAQEESSVDGVIFSKADLCINGSGTLKINAAYKHGIVSKDDLIVTGGTLRVTANGQGLYGKDAVKIQNGTFELSTQGDGIQSDNAEDASRGLIYIENGSFEIEAATDGIQAESYLLIQNGTFAVTCGGGSGNASTDQNGEFRPQWGTTSQGETASMKALKCGGDLAVNGGTFDIDSSDDAVHSNGNVTLSGGIWHIASGDDGVHADSALLITGGTVSITKSYEGLEAQSVTVRGGEIDVTASDDGINAAGGNDGSSMGGRPGQNPFDADETCEIRISGGTVHLNAGGDGVDSNGAFYMEGGTVYVDGPTNGGNGSLDYGTEAVATGGTLVALGSAGMLAGFTNASTQFSFSYILTDVHPAGTTVTLTDAQGNTVFSYQSEKQFQSVVATAPQLQAGDYTLTVGDFAAELKLSGVVTAYGSIGGFNPGGGDHGGGPGGGFNPGGGDHGGGPGGRPPR